ncbi:oligosaccharide flippase family protein [Aerococcaceae bacterium WGS1372]
MDKQHNNPDKLSDLSQKHNNKTDLSRTIEFSEKEKNLLRRPNRQPLDSDYFEQTTNKQDRLENSEVVEEEDIHSKEDNFDSMDYFDELDENNSDYKSKNNSKEPINEFRYKPLKERLQEERLKSEQETLQNNEIKPKRKALGDLFNPSFEEKYDLNELEDISGYNQYANSENKSEDRKGFIHSVKSMFSKSKNDEETEEVLDETANKKFEEEVHQTDWLHQDDYGTEQYDADGSEDRDVEDEYVIDASVIDEEERQNISETSDETIYPTDMDEDSIIDSDEDIEFEEITELYVDTEEAENNISENLTKDPQEENKLAEKDRVFTNKAISDEELKELSTRISQETAAFDEPILTDQALNDYYGQEDIQMNSAYDNDEKYADEVESDKEGITVGASWLTIGNVLSRVIGALYVIPWASWLGEDYTQANVLYSIGYKPYSLILAVATAGFPSSIAKQMAFYHSKKEYKTADKLFKNSLLVMLVTGIVSALLLFVLAPLVAGASSTTNVVGATQVIRSLAPALLILPIMSLLRGYFQGFNDMKPTAISQILEQFARVGYLLAATYAVMMVLRGEVTTAVVHSTFAAFIGALLSLIYLIIEYFRRLPVIKKLQETSEETVDLSFQESMKIMVVDSIPFILLGSGIIIAQLIDQFTFGQILSSTSTFLFSEISEMYGALSLDVDKLVMIIISLAVSLASSLVPTISKLFARRDVEGTSSLVEHILLLFTIIMVPASLGMASIANNIYFFFYPAGFELGPNILITASISSIVLGAYTVLSTILQSMNYRRLAVRFLLVGIVVKAILQYPAVALLQAHGALISTAIAFLVSSVLMCMKLDRELNLDYRKLRSGGIKILVAAILMTISAVMWNESLNLLFGPVGRGLTFLKIVIVIIMAILTYGSILAITNMLPVLIGNRYKELQDKMRLM